LRGTTQVQEYHLYNSRKATNGIKKIRGATNENKKNHFSHTSRA
jgi:hypothetical protein